MSTASEPDIFLYSHPVSSYAQKIKIALREKGVPFTEEVPSDISAAVPGGPFATANPRAEVPVLISRTDDATIFDSTIILEYIEDRWTEPALLPKSPKDRASARLIEEICDTHYEAVNWGIGEIRWFKRAGDENSELFKTLSSQAATHTRTLQDWLTEQLESKPWFGGDRFGWADVCVAPILNRSVSYGLGPDPSSPLGQWHARLKERPSVQVTFKEFEAAVVNMPAAANIYISGQKKREYRDHRLEWMIKAGGMQIVADGIENNNVRFSWP